MPPPVVRTPSRLTNRRGALPLISQAELALHTKRDDAWISVAGTVYDITPHLVHHPGWTQAGVSTVLAIMNVPSATWTLTVTLTVTLTLILTLKPIPTVD